MKPYLIDLNDPNDCIGKYIDEHRDSNFVKERLDLLLMLPEPGNLHEIAKSVFYKGNENHYHMHRRGYETMFVRGGEIELTIRGMKCRVTGGDIIHLGCYNAHRMVWLQDSPWIGLFHNMYVCKSLDDKMLLNENCPDMTEAEIDESYWESYDVYYMPKPDAAEAPESGVQEVRAPGFAFATFDSDGVKMRQKVGRWETGGLYDIWELNMEDGFCGGCGKPNPKACIYYVTEGIVDFKVFDKEFRAPKESIVHIPAYATHSFKSIGNSVMYDTFSGTLIHDLASEWKSYEINAPEKLKDKEFVDALKKKYNCYITQWGRY